MTQEVYSATLRDKKDQAVPTALLSKALTLDLSLHHPPPWLNARGCLRVVCVTGSSAVWTSQPLPSSLPSLLGTLLTSSVSGSPSSPLDRRDDPDASSHPTRHVTCFRRAQDAFWAPCHVLIQKITSENTFHSQHSPRVCQISFGPDTWSGPSLSAMFLQYILPVPSDISHLNDDNMTQYCSPSSWTEWVPLAPD